MEAGSDSTIWQLGMFLRSRSRSTWPCSFIFDDLNLCFLIPPHVSSISKGDGLLWGGGGPTPVVCSTYANLDLAWHQEADPAQSQLLPALTVSHRAQVHYFKLLSVFLELINRVHHQVKVKKVRSRGSSHGNCEVRTVRGTGGCTRGRYW